MRNLLIVLSCLFSLNALAQKHMVEFNAESALIGQLQLSESKRKNSSKDHDNLGYLYLNYAYAITPNIQSAIQASYQKISFSSFKQESYDVMVGKIYNLSTDLRNSVYGALYLGMGWTNSYGEGNSREEELKSRLTIGKRFALTALNLPNVTYSPEISAGFDSATKSDNADWEKNYSVKYLQFSVLF